MNIARPERITKTERKDEIQTDSKSGVFILLPEKITLIKYNEMFNKTID
jgi:hypothetical protein